MIRASEPLHVTREAEQLGRRLAIHVSAGRYGLARRVLGLAIAEACRPRVAEPVTPETPLAALELPLRMVNLLEAAGVRTIADANRLADVDLAALENLGPVGVRELRAAVRAGLSHGLAHPV